MSLVISQEHLDKLQEDREIEGIFVANSLQQGFIYAALNRSGNDDAYIVQGVWQYQTTLNVDTLKQAWQYAQKRYPSLRLRFAWEEELIQIIDQEGNLDWRFIDLSDETDEAKQNQFILHIQEQDRNEPYKLEAGNLFRVYLLKQKKDLYTCILSNHHSVLDGWSIPILQEYVHDTYLKLNAHEIVDYATDPSYKEAQRYLQKHRFGNNDYWKGYLATLHEQVDLNGLLTAAKKNIKLKEYKWITEPEEVKLVISDQETQKIKAVSQRYNLTLNAILQFSWHQILKIYGNCEQTIAAEISRRKQGYD